MNLEQIVRLLTNSGITVIGADSSNVYIQDPSCILSGIETFIQYAWIVITIVTAFLLTGWAISLIRGAKTDLFTNMRNLIIMFVTLSLVTPIINVIWGDDIRTHLCKTVTVSLNDLNTLLDARDANLRNTNNDLYENIDIYDSGAIGSNEQPVTLFDGNNKINPPEPDPTKPVPISYRPGIDDEPQRVMY